MNVKFGNALIKGTVGDVRGTTVFVTLDQSNLRLGVKIDQVVLSGPQPTHPMPSPKPPLPPTIGKTDLTLKRKSLEALRFGLVPAYALEEMTVGLDKIKRWIISRLPVQTAKEPTVSEICGQYGTGKSHTMALIRHVAKQQNYVTAHVEINGRDISLEDPGMLSSHLWKSIEAENLISDTPLIDIYLKAIERGATWSNISGVVAIDKIKNNYAPFLNLCLKSWIELHYMV